MADIAIDVLVRTIRRRDNTRVLVNHVVPHRLVERDSVCPPPKRR